MLRVRREWRPISRWSSKTNGREECVKERPWDTNCHEKGSTERIMKSVAELWGYRASDRTYNLILLDKLSSKPQAPFSLPM